MRSTSAADALARREAWSSTPEGEGGPRPPCPPLAQICGVFLNAIFLDHLDTDVDHLQRMNELVAAHGGMNGASPHAAMRQITPLVISPSEDLALVAQRFAHRMPRLLRFVMDGLGTPDAQSADLMSYLLFDSAYTGTLVEIGYRDARRAHRRDRGADPGLSQPGRGLSRSRPAGSAAGGRTPSAASSLGRRGAARRAA